MNRTLLLIATLAFVAIALPQLPQPDPSAWAAKDSHQGFTVAADAYSDPSRTKTKFAKADPYKAGILAVDVFLKNDTAYPVHVDLSTIRLDVDTPDGQHFHLPSLTLAQAANQIAHPKGASLSPPHRLPPILSSSEDSKSRDVRTRLEPLALQTDVVPPNGAVRGFVFFDVSSDFDAVAHASLYVPDVKSVVSDNGMIYFDVPLQPKQH